MKSQFNDGTLMMVATYTESLLNDGSALDGHLKSNIGPPS